jgi:hypothetical protein
MELRAGERLDPRSFHTTINVLEGLLETRATGGSAELARARARAEYLLERRLLRRLSNGELIHPSLAVSFPHGYRYDGCRARAPARGGSRARCASRGHRPRPRRRDAGRWLLEKFLR